MRQSTNEHPPVSQQTYNTLSMVNENSELTDSDKNMPDVLYNTLAITKAPEKLQEFIPSEYAHLSKVLSTKSRGSPPPVPAGPKPPARKESLSSHHPIGNITPAPPVPTRRNNNNNNNNNQNPPAQNSINLQKLPNLYNLGSIGINNYPSLSSFDNILPQFAHPSDPKSAGGKSAIHKTLTYQPKFDDFKILKVLGQGSFGKVLLAQFKNSNKYVAIKALSKNATIDNNDVTATIVERDILAMGSDKNNCSFLASLICCFQDPDRLYFVMEFLSGGDLMFHVQKKTRFRTHEARFYACQIACALEFLHNNKIVYRDLKLDNVLLDADGHCNLADFGMCKKDVSDHNRCATFCGTPDYLAPEIVRGRLYTFSVDWWSFGVLWCRFFEKLLGWKLG